MGRVSVSLDDVKGIFKALRREETGSIFDTRLLAFLRDMHRRYGTAFDLYCTCRQDGYFLGGVPSRYAGEFRENGDWLRFGFHCYEESDRYGAEGVEAFLRKIDGFFRDIAACTGQEKGPEGLRLHGFQGNREVCRILRLKGVERLFAADDGRRSYYLDQAAHMELEETGAYYDAKMGLHFYRSCTRLENAGDIGKEIAACMEKGMEVIPVFTHEWQMDRADIREKMELCCRWEAWLRGGGVGDRSGI